MIVQLTAVLKYNAALFLCSSFSKRYFIIVTVFDFIFFTLLPLEQP